MKIRLIASLAIATIALAIGSHFAHAQAFSDSNWVSIPGADGPVQAAVVDGSGNLYIGGSFTSVGGVPANSIAKWDGSTWTALGSGMTGVDSFNTAVYALALLGGDLYAGGVFTNAGGTPVLNIAKWNGSAWSSLGSGTSGSVFALAVLGGELYVGGGFTSAGGVPANSIARWNGSSWTALSSGMDSTVYALAVSGGDLYAGGQFRFAGGVLANRIAKWDGSNWSALGSGMSGAPGVPPNVYALAVSGSDLYAGGAFTIADGNPANHLAKWDGTSWAPLGAGMGGAFAGFGPTSVFAFGLSGSDLYAGGNFTTAGGSPANAIAKWNGSSWNALGSGMNHLVVALALSGNDLYAGGRFTMAGGKEAPYVAHAILGNAPGYNRLTWRLLSDGALELSFVGDPGTDYALERTFNLIPPISWTGRQTNTMPASGVLTFTDTPAPNTNNFWRVRSMP